MLKTYFTVYNGQLHNCQSWSFITVHKIQKKAYFLFVINLITISKKIWRLGVAWKFVELSIDMNIFAYLLNRRVHVFWWTTYGLVFSVDCINKVGVWCKLVVVGPGIVVLTITVLFTTVDPRIANSPFIFLNQARGNLVPIIICAQVELF